MKCPLGEDAPRTAPCSENISCRACVPPLPDINDLEAVKTYNALIGGFPREALASCTSYVQVVRAFLLLTGATPAIRQDERQSIRRVARDYSLDPSGFAALLGERP